LPAVVHRATKNEGFLRLFGPWPNSKWKGSVNPRAPLLPYSKARAPACTFQQALALHGRGRLAEAAVLYEGVLRADRRHFGAVYRLGFIRLQQCRFDDAERLFRRAVKLDRNSADAQLHLATALTGLDRDGEAIWHFEKALALRPDYAEAHNNFGCTLQRLGRHQEAAGHYENALALVPGYAEARNNLGNALQLLRRSDEAIVQLGHALALRPDYPEAHNNLGNVLGTLGRNEEAIAQYEKAIAVRPRYAEARFSWGNALKAMERHEEAIAQYEKAIAIRPGYAEAHMHLGNSLGALGREAQAVEHYERAIALRPQCAEAHMHLGNALMALGRSGEAVTCFDQALSIKSELTGARLNRGFAYLHLGDWAQGWRDYQLRWEDSQDKRDFRRPLWLGDAPVEGRTVFLHAEQGLGDTLMSARYVSRVASAGAKVVLEVPLPLRALMARLPCVSQVISHGEAWPDFDLHCPLMSLPLAFGTTLETVPVEIPYLDAPPDQVLAWRRRLGDFDGPRIGIAWHGNPRPEPKRSIPLSMFLGIAPPHVQLVSIQKDIPDDHRDLLRRHHIPHFDADSGHQDFSDTAAIIASMDLVVSIDTSMAHLAGAMGKPTWILLRATSDWRWLLDRDDCVWYPTARLIRQAVRDDWKSVIGRVHDELSRRWTNGRA
jgi:tetratricopeptide (TPR) repeat protein